MSKNLFIFDLDGTLIPPSSQYPTSNTINTIKMASERNDVIIATARPRFGVFHILKEVEDKIYGFVFLNGAITKFDNTLSYAKPFEEDFISLILNLDIEIDNLWLYSLNDWYVSNNNSSIYKRERKAVQKVGQLLEKYNFDLIYKIVIISKNTNNILDLIVDKNITTSFSNKNYLEITPENINKLIGIKKIINKKSYKNIFSIGDSFNDIPFLEYSTYSCTIHNGHKKIKSIVDYVSDKKYADGCIDCIEHIKSKF